MADMMGMNAWEIRQLAQAMTRTAGDLARVAQAASAEITGAEWRGPDREWFVSTWTGQHAAGLLRAAEGLQEAAREAARSAEAQERASRAT